MISVQSSLRLLIILSLLIQVSRARANTDSLVAIIENKDVGLDVKVDLYPEIIDSYYNEPAKAISYALDYIAKAREYGSNFLIADAYNKAGIVFYSMGNYEQTLEYFKESLNIEQSDSSFTQTQISSVLNNIGIVYDQLNQPELAMDYYSRSIDLKKKTADSIYLSSTYTNLGLILLDKEIADSALYYFYEARRLDKKLGYVAGEMYAAFNIGLYHQKTTNFDSASWYYDRSIYLADSLQETMSLTETVMQKAELYIEWNKYLEALQVLNQLENGPEGLQDPMLLRYLKAMADIKERTGAYQEAYQYFSKYTTLKDSLYTEDVNNRLEGIETSFAVASREKEIELLQQEKTIQNLTLQRNRFILFILILALVSISIVLYVLFRKNNQLDKSNLSLEQKNVEIAAKNEDILDSIMYAKGIQESIFPSPEQLGAYFKETTMFSQPRDIVNGDFCWVAEKDGKKILAVGDCTGHGVPGAFMTVMSNVMLNQIVFEENTTSPHLILEKLNKKVFSNLYKKHFGIQTADSIDLAILSMDDNEIQFAGAKRPILVYSKKAASLERINGDKYGIGGYWNTLQRSYTLHTWPNHSEKVFYFYTDGITDQFGGENNKKFLTKRLLQYIEEFNSTGMRLRHQGQELERIINRWKGTEIQTDDMLFVAISE